MKICWDNLEGFHLTKFGFLRKGGHSYVERETCKRCGDNYLMHKAYPTEYCSLSCAQKGRKTSDATKKKLSIAGLGHKRSKEECEAISKRLSKGGVVAKNLPLYDTYAKQLIPIEEVRRSEQNPLLLEIKCVKCGDWFVPKRTVCEQRCQFIKGNVDRENRFYCSDQCRMLCSIFHKKKYPSGLNPRKSRNSSFTEAELRIWREEVLKRADYKCEYCGVEANIAHHIRPKKLEPFFALDPDYGLACCEKCHYKYAHQGDCNTGYLANVKCQ